MFRNAVRIIPFCCPDVAVMLSGCHRNRCPDVAEICKRPCAWIARYNWRCLPGFLRENHLPEKRGTCNLRVMATSGAVYTKYQHQHEKAPTCWVRTQLKLTVCFPITTDIALYSFIFVFLHSSIITPGVTISIS